MSDFSSEPSESTSIWRVTFLCCFTIVLPFVIPILQGRILGQDERIGDRANSLWLHWYAAEGWDWSLPFGQTDAFVYPVGVDLWAELFNVFDAFVAIPLVWLFGWGMHYNVLVVILALLAVISGRLWASLWSDSKVVGWWTGLLFASGTSLFHAVEMGRIVQVGIATIPLAMWAVHRLRQVGSWERGLVAGLTVGLAGTWYLYWGYGLVLWMILWCPWQRAWKEVGWWLCAMVGGLVAWFNLSHLDLAYVQREAVQTGTDFPTLSEAFQPQHYDTAGSIIEGSLSIGWLGWSGTHSVSLLLMFFALLGFFGERRDEGLRIGLGLLLFTILGMGPYLLFGSGDLLSGWVLKNPLYLWLYEYLPLVSRMHWPHRWLPFLVALLVPWTTSGVLWSQRVGKLIWFLPVLIVGEWVYKGQWNLSSTEVVTSKCYLQLASENPNSPIVLLPFTHSSRAAVFQPIHQHPIVNPISISYEPSRWPDDYRVQLAEPLLVWAQSTDQPQSRIQPPTVVKESAKKLGVSHIVYHRDYLEDALYDPNAPMALTVDDNTRIQSITQGIGTPNCSDPQIVVWRMQD